MTENDSPNPYTSPQTPAGEPVDPNSDRSQRPCPACGNSQVKKIKWTMWGGALGPKLFHHVKCLQCNATFNSKTGKSNATAVAVYLAISIVVGLGLGVMLAVSMRR